MGRKGTVESSALRVIRGLLVLWSGVGVCACGGSPVAPPPPPDDPPKITCPAPVSVTSPTGQPIPVSYGTPTVALGKAPVTTNCTPPSNSIFAIGSNTVTCTATDALQRTDTCTFTVTVAVPPKINLTRFDAFGDSITWGEDGQFSTTSLSIPDLIRPAVQVATPYPNQLQLLLMTRYALQSMSVANSGCRGELAADKSSPCTGTPTTVRFAGVIGGGAYQAVLLMEGSNDVNAQSNANGDPSYATAAISSLRTMIEFAKSRNVRPYLATIPPMNPLAGTPARRGVGANYVAPFNSQLSALASSENVTLVDVYTAINSDPSWSTTLIGPDGLHPTQAGYNLIAQTFFTALKSTLEVTASPSMTFSAPLSVPARTGSSARPAATGPGPRPVTRRPR